MPQPLKRASGVNHLSRSLTCEWDQYTRKYMRYSGAMRMISEEGRRLQKPCLRLSKPGDKVIHLVQCLELAKGSQQASHSASAYVEEVRPCR